MNNLFAYLIAGLLFLAIPVIAFLGFTLIYYIICMCFGLAFSWLYALGIFLICLLIRWVISAARSKNND